MAKDLRGTWKDTGTSLGHAFRDLGKTLIKTGATAARKADNWANGENSAEAAAQQEAQEKANQEAENDSQDND